MSKMIEIIEFGRVYGEPGNVQWIDLYVNLQNSGISGVGKESLILSTWARVLFSSLLLPDRSFSPPGGCCVSPAAAAPRFLPLCPSRHQLCSLACLLPASVCWNRRDISTQVGGSVPHPNCLFLLLSWSLSLSSICTFVL